ncbi:MAG: FkbM family methyltransferase [Verrucomicrobia bacterium]|jgi:FkbM family methyltransferase|nr:FkbM family methyltransferase [Verrucomicrobiota bacterium]
MQFLKASLRSLCHRLGYEIVPRSPTPLLAELTWARNELCRTGREFGAAVQHFGHAVDECHLAWILQALDIALVIDVGANHGQFAATCRRLGFRGRLVSFEPTPPLVQALSTAAANDPQWQVIGKALGATPGEAELQVFGDSSFNSLHTANPAGQSAFPDWMRPNGTARVPVSTLAAEWPACRGDLVRPRCLLKTDTQGHDLEVLRGAGSILPEVDAVACEAAMTPLYAGAPVYHETFAFLEQHGFVLSGLYPVSHLPAHPGLIEVNAYFVRRPAG